MPRPSRNTDQLLIEAARKRLPVTGCSGLSLRQIASDAKVNLGMFHYHFGSKDEFIRRVLADVYEEFFKRLSIETQTVESGKKANLEALARGLGALGRFARDNRRLILALIRDVLSGNREVTAFLEKNIPRHFGVLRSLVEQCQRDGSLTSDVPPISVLMFAMGAVGFPNIATALLDKAYETMKTGARRKVLAGVLQKNVLSDAAIDRRVKGALYGLGGTL